MLGLHRFFIAVVEGQLSGGLQGKTGYGNARPKLVQDFWAVYAAIPWAGTFEF